MSNQFVDSSFQSSVFQEENMLLDQLLKRDYLWRKPQPRDGNSIFRAIAEHIFKSQLLFSKVKNNYFNYISNHPVHIRQITERMLPYLISCYDNDLNKITVNLSVLSQLYRINFKIYQEGRDTHTISYNNIQPVDILSLARLEEDHFDILYPDAHRDNLAFVQSVFYSILYKNVFQIDLPLSRKNFTLQTIREPYFITQDAYEFSHLERCFNIFYFENISLSLWRSEFSSNSISIASNTPCLKLSSYSLGDEVRVYSPNTENMPYYLGKIINLNVTPGMHEVLASNRGTEIVDIGHLQPAYDECNQCQFSSHTDVLNPERSPIQSLKVNDQVISIDDAKNSLEEFEPSFKETCDISRNGDSDPIQSSSSNIHSPSNSFTELNSWEINSKSNQVPPGFEDEDLIHGVQQSDDKNPPNSSIIYKTTHNLTNIQGPKHKYGPQSAVVKQKYQHEHYFKESGSTLVMKPFEQIYENAHSQIKKLQFKLNNNAGFLSPKFSIHPEGSDLPEDKFILQYFYNLGVQYQLMRSHGSSWKDVLPNSCPPLYHDSNYHTSNQMVPLMFRDTAGMYFSQDMVVPNYFYDMAMMPFIQGYAPPLSYNLQGEPFIVQNYGKHFKEESDSDKFHSSIKQDAIYGSEEIPNQRSNSLLKSKPEIESQFPNSGSLDSFEVSPIHILNYKKPLDDIQSDPSSWPQPGGDKNDITWINNDLIESQRAEYSNALKKGTQNKQPTYTAERTIYASNTSGTKNSIPKKNYPNSQNVSINSYSTRKT